MTRTASRSARIDATVPPVAPPAAVTADEFLRHAATHESDELVNGVIVPMSSAGRKHRSIASALFGHLWTHVEARGLGEAFVDNIGYSLPIPGARADTVRSPDVSFVAAERLPEMSERYLRLAPDLAAEVLSPDNTAAEMDARIADYLAAGARLVWVVDPDRRTVAVYSASALVRWLGPADALDGGDVVPGFALALPALFRRLDRPAGGAGRATPGGPDAAGGRAGG